MKEATNNLYGIGHVVYRMDITPVGKMGIVETKVLKDDIMGIEPGRPLAPIMDKNTECFTTTASTAEDAKGRGGSGHAAKKDS